MKRKLIVSDLDGTLFNSKKEIAESDIKIIQRLISDGHLFTVATSRHYLTLRKYLKDIYNECPIITANGSLIYDVLNDEVIFANYMEESTIKDICKIALRNNYRTMFQAKGRLLLSSGHSFIKKYKEGDIHIRNICADVIPEEVDIDKDFDMSGIIQISFQTEDVKGLMETFEKEINNPYIEFVNTSEGIVVCKPANTSKATAIEFLLNYYQMDKDDLIVCGDDNNDIEMFDYAIHSIAPSNARDSIKERAEYVSLSNDEHGITYALENYYKL
ncbi:MAG: HAD family hydrolase [Erysipelotrichaceae bacterium]|nr:HAD family hydrolase [Erysipelotrichaceae bacterium]